MKRRAGDFLISTAARNLTLKQSKPGWSNPFPKQSAPFSASANAKTSDNGSNRQNISLFGPPGSGKGSYGKHFAKSLEIPLVTTSDVLRKLRPDLVDQMSEGKLVDDRVVGQTVLAGLEEMQLNDRGYILDGFPRTLEQVALMEDTWPESFRVQTVVHLDVADFVCSTKLLGRRSCSKCGKSFNVNGVDQDGWTMPPFLPNEGQTCEDMICDYSVKRDDDTPEIVGERLKVYHENADPILNYIRANPLDQKGKDKQYRLLTLRPYNGFDDLPELVETLRRNVNGFDEEV